MGMQCFRDVTLAGFSPSAEGGQMMFVDVKFRESDGFSLGVFTDAQRMAPEVKFSQNNMFGRAFSGYVEFSPKGSSGGAVGGGMDGDGADDAGGTGWMGNAAGRVPMPTSLSLFRIGLRSYKPWLGQYAEYSASRQRPWITRNDASDETVTQAGASTSFGGAVQNTFGISSQWREVQARTPEKEELLRQCGETESNRKDEVHGITWDLTTDRRRYHSDPDMRQVYPHPVGGWAAWCSLRGSGDTVGMGSDGGVDGVRWEARLHRLFPVGRWLTLSCGLRAGAMHSPPHRKLALSDRFYAEKDVVRGWGRVGETLSAGDRDAGLRGGDALCAASASVSCPLAVGPLPKGMFAAHAFANAASVVNSPTGDDRGDWPAWDKALRRGAAASYGVGVVITALPMLGTMGRLEFNASQDFPITGSVGRQADFRRWSFGLQWQQ